MRPEREGHRPPWAQRGAGGLQRTSGAQDAGRDAPEFGSGASVGYMAKERIPALVRQCIGRIERAGDDAAADIGGAAGAEQRIERARVGQDGKACGGIGAVLDHRAMRQPRDGGMAGLYDPALMARKAAAEENFRRRLADAGQYPDALAAYEKIAAAQQVISANVKRFWLLEQGHGFNADSYTLARSLLRAGETVSMKHVLRTQTSKGFGLPDAKPDTLLITHMGSGQQYALQLGWRKTATGGLSAENSFSIPQGAKLGAYQVQLTSGNGRQDFYTGEFRVEEFRLPVLEPLQGFYWRADFTLVPGEIIHDYLGEQP